MPQRYEYTSHTTWVSCSRCNRTEGFAGRTPSAHDIERIHPAIRYSRGRFSSWCRSCEAESRRANRNNPNRAARRANGQTVSSSAPLGDQRKFGVELEVMLPQHVTRGELQQNLLDAGLPGWRVKGDGSLSGGNGMEVVSPALRGEVGLEQVRTACRVLREKGATVNRSCGFHCHHDVRDLTLDDWKRVVQTWSNNQATVDGLVSQSRRNNGYCRPLRGSEVAAINRCTTIQEFRTAIYDRYRTLNVCSFPRHGTLEFRQHQGTTDYRKIEAWVKFGQAIIDSAKVMRQAVGQSSRVSMFLNAIGADEDTSAFLIGRAVQFGVVSA